MNFRIDSDIVDYFGNIEYELRISRKRYYKRKKNLVQEIMSPKTGLAVWAVSNCNNTYGAIGRMKYAESLLEAGLNLTTYGDCFGKRFNDPKEFTKYKFYLAFENSIHCPDYISEKFWRNGFRSGAVPIVWGSSKRDVDKVAPPNSYIHTDKFESPGQLVTYINYLNSNETAYMEYHAWRKIPINRNIPDEDIEPNHRSTFCRLCKMATERPLQHRTVPSVYHWLYETKYEDDLCFKNIT